MSSEHAEHGYKVIPNHTPGNIGDHGAKRASFSWGQARDVLDFPHDRFNLGWYCSDRICELGLGEKPALIWESAGGQVEQFDFEALRGYSNAWAEYLQSLGLKPGEVVAFYLDRVPDYYLGFLGGLKLGLVMQPMFSAFGEEALMQRIHSADTVAVVTSSKLADKVRAIRSECPSIRQVVLLDGEPQFDEKQFSYRGARPVGDFAVFEAPAEHPSILHYTSGTTGLPKGAQHVHGSLPAQALTAKWVLDLREDDIYWCTADPGWVTGTSYGILGPWSLGVTQVVSEGRFSADNWYRILQDHKVTVWYTAPTAIRMLMREDPTVVRKYDFSSLRHMCSVGEPLNPEGVVWGMEAFGLPFHDTWWQTETGAQMIVNLPGMPIQPGSMGKPFPGIMAAVLTDDFRPIDEPGVSGLLALRVEGFPFSGPAPWPSIFRTYLGRQDAYESKFKHGWYITGDRAHIDGDGYFWFEGRDDDVINTSGHLVGPFEVESALIEHEAVAESAAVGKPDPLKMEVVKAFVALKPGYEPSDELAAQIIKFVRTLLSPYAAPAEIEFIDKLPKTRSGKIMRRLLKAKETGADLGDTSTLED
jgi:acetyl-CoA synthetase